MLELTWDEQSEEASASPVAFRHCHEPLLPQPQETAELPTSLVPDARPEDYVQFSQTDCSSDLLLPAFFLYLLWPELERGETWGHAGRVEIFCGKVREGEDGEVICLDLPRRHKAEMPSEDDREEGPVDTQQP